MSKFTPGPWTNEEMLHAAYFHTGNQNYFNLKTRDNGEQSGLANARLIAAAPDMYAALEEVARYIDKGGAKTISEAIDSLSWMERLTEQVKAAIAKAATP